MPLWTMKVVSKAYDISTLHSAHPSDSLPPMESFTPIRVEIITDFDKLCVSKLAFDKILTLTIREKPDILIFFGRTGVSGKSQKKIASLFYTLERFQISPKRIFVVPDRKLYEYLLGSSSMLIYYVDYFKTFNAEVEFEGIEEITDSLRFIMASSKDRIEYLKDTLKGTVLILADTPENHVIPELFVVKKSPDYTRKIPSYIFVTPKGITFLNLY